jgi:hypothetical protein
VLLALFSLDSSTCADPRPVKAMSGCRRHVGYAVRAASSTMGTFAGRLDLLAWVVLARRQHQSTTPPFHAGNDLVQAGVAGERGACRLVRDFVARYLELGPRDRGV